MAAVDNNIKGRLALITGASGGIGRACALKLVRQDVDLALTYSNNKLAIDELVAELRQVHDREIPDAGYLRISTHKVDLANADECIKLCEDVRKEHGKPVQLLISNAGHGKRITNIWDIPLEEFDYTINVNLRASFLLVKGVIEGMKEKRWGRIVFVGSIAAYGAGINGCHYAASKAGLMGMMKNLSTRLVEYNITVNDVAPAMIGDTGMIPNADIIPGGMATMPIGRLGTPEEVANVVYMYCTTGYATGQSVILSGGLPHK